MVGVDSTVRDGLVRCATGGLKVCVGENTIVAVIVFDADVVGSRKAFKREFRLITEAASLR